MQYSLTGTSTPLSLLNTHTCTHAHTHAHMHAHTRTHAHAHTHTREETSMFGKRPGYQVSLKKMAQLQEKIEGWEGPDISSSCTEFIMGTFVC